jgi:maltose alpha-D-glucosyltransferase/alpha-amylase
MKRLIDLRKRFKAFGWGSLEFIPLDNSKVLALIRKFEDETILVLINLSRSAQFVTINNPRFVGFFLEDILSRNRFPAIKDAPYLVLVGPYGYHLMLMTQGGEKTAPEVPVPGLAVAGAWEGVLEGAGLSQLEQYLLPEYLKKCRWFQGKGRTIAHVSLAGKVPIPIDSSTVMLTFIEVNYSEGSSETYQLPLHFLPLSAGGDALLSEFPWAVVSHLRVSQEAGILYDALASAPFRQALFRLITYRKGVTSVGGKLSGRPGTRFTALLGDRELPLKSQVGTSEQSNSAVVYEKSFLLKLYRRVEEGIHPEAEIGRFLSERTRFSQVAPLAGVLEYRVENAEPATLAILQGFLPNQGDAWALTLGEVGQFMDRVLAHREGEKEPLQPETVALPAAGAAGAPAAWLGMMGGFYPEMVALLGKRTAEFHLALCSRYDDDAFKPEAFALLYQRSVYQSMRSRAKKAIALLQRSLDEMPEKLRPETEALLSREPDILAQLHSFATVKFSAWKTRIHGDYHLGQVLYTGNDFAIIDFEGEPVKSLSERRIKQSPLKDVAGMMRSFYYAAYAVLQKRSRMRDEDIPYLTPWAEAWYRYNSGVFLAAYLESVAGSGLIPKEPAQANAMLHIYLLDKAIYELGYELNNRPDWVSIPLRGVIGLLDAGSTGGKPDNPPEGGTAV